MAAPHGPYECSILKVRRRAELSKGDGLFWFAVNMRIRTNRGQGRKAYGGPALHESRGLPKIAL
jgi:hypothetical protein